MAKAKLRRGIEMVKLANRIEALKHLEEDPEDSDLMDETMAPADASVAGPSQSSDGGKRTLAKTVKGAIFREVVMAKVREMKQQEADAKIQEGRTA